MSNGIIRRLDNNQIKGEIITRTINEKFLLNENIDKQRNDKAPDYIIHGVSSVHGGTYQLGVGWVSLGKQDHNRGQKIFTLVLDDPSFGDKPIYFNGYPRSENEWEIRFDRSNRQPQAQAAA